MEGKKEEVELYECIIIYSRDLRIRVEVFLEMVNGVIFVDYVVLGLL